MRSCCPICFGSFELHLDSGELFKRGRHKIRLQKQPFDILAALLARPGEVVTREELKQRVWPADTIVDFDRGVNRAIKKIRDALSDSTGKPRFIETLHRRGYRFIGSIEQRYTGTETDRPEGIPSIGVLPFVSVDNNIETDYLGEGISETITNSLSKLSRLRVAPRTTMLRSRGLDLSPQNIGRESNIQHLLTGKIIQNAGTVRVQAELVSTIDGRQLWGRHYTHALSGIFDIEAEIAQEITAALQVQLTDEDRFRFSKRHTLNDEAYRLYLQGRYFWNRRVAPRAIECFEQATQADPNFALAWAGLANAYAMYFAYQIAAPAESVQRAKESASIALRIDPATAEAHACLGFVKSFYDWDWQAGEQHFRRAIELDPGLGTTQAWFAHALSARNRNDEASAVLAKALENEPASPALYVVAVQTLLQVGHRKEALEVCRKAFDLDPHLAVVSWALGLVYVEAGDYGKAIAAFRHALQVRIPSSKIPVTSALAWLGHAYGRSGITQRAEQTLEDLNQEKGKRYVSPYSLALVEFGLGNKEQGFKMLQEAWEDHSFWLAFFAPLTIKLFACEDDPRSLDLLRRMNLS